MPLPRKKKVKPVSEEVVLLKRLTVAIEKQTALLEKYDQLFFPVIEKLMSPDIMDKLKKVFNEA